MDIYTVSDISIVTGFSYNKVLKCLKKLGIRIPASDIGMNRTKSGFTNIRQAARICRDINPDEITVQYAIEKLRNINTYY